MNVRVLDPGTSAVASSFSRATSPLVYEFGHTRVHVPKIDSLLTFSSGGLKAKGPSTGSRERSVRFRLVERF
jgi:hypothetical protein